MGSVVGFGQCVSETEQKVRGLLICRVALPAPNAQRPTCSLQRLTCSTSVQVNLSSPKTLLGQSVRVAALRSEPVGQNAGWWISWPDRSVALRLVLYRPGTAGGLTAVIYSY